MRRTWLSALQSLAWLAFAKCGPALAEPSLHDLSDPWVNEHGQQVHLSQWRGRPAIIAMEYSECRFICSAYWLHLMKVQQEADKRGLALDFVILSIDPEHDSPAAWRAYRRTRDLRRTNWHFLTASRAATNRAAALLQVRWWYAEGHLMHDFRINRIDAQGRVVATNSNYTESASSLLAGL